MVEELVGEVVGEVTDEALDQNFDVRAEGIFKEVIGRAEADDGIVYPLSE